MTVTVTTKALNSGLVTLVDLKVAIAPGDLDDVFLTSAIVRATNHIERITRRKFAREVVTETFNGSGRTDQILSRFPLANLGALTRESATIATTEYGILDVDSGLAFMETGWVENVMTSRDITVRYTNQYGDFNHSLVYTAGYLMSGDNIIANTAITSDSTGKTFTLPTGSKWPLFVPGDKVTFAGFVNTALNEEFTIATRDTDLQITVSDTIATEVGTIVTMICQTLPDDLIQACIEIVSFWFQGRKRGGSLSSEKIGDWAGVYNNSLPANAIKIVNSYRTIF